MQCTPYSVYSEHSRAIHLHWLGPVPSAESVYQYNYRVREPRVGCNCGAEIIRSRQYRLQLVGLGVPAASYRNPKLRRGVMVVVDGGTILPFC